VTVTIVSRDVGLNFAVGDRFDIALTVDDTVMDTRNDVGAGLFPGLLTAFSMTADPTNLGSWTPSGTFDLAASNFVTNAFGDNFTFQLRGFGFPSGDALGLPFHDVDISFNWPGDLTDSGVGDAFGAQFPGGFDFAMASMRPGAIRFDDGNLGFPSAVFVPEPVTALLAPAALVALRRARRRGAVGA
jgi:hypothetical protein